jgi:formiminotetrahydrofolate cyclodeaminase
VMINMPGIESEDYRRTVSAKAAELLEKTQGISARVQKTVLLKLNGGE